MLASDDHEVDREELLAMQLAIDLKPLTGILVARTNRELELVLVARDALRDQCSRGRLGRDRFSYFYVFDFSGFVTRPFSTRFLPTILE